MSTANQPKKVIPAQDGSLLLSAGVGKGVGPKIAYMPEESAFGLLRKIKLSGMKR